MVNLHELTAEILKDGYLMSLGVVDADGVWVSDVVYVYDSDFVLYWISKTNARHSLAIDTNPIVACTITAAERVDEERALQIKGKAERVAGPLFELEKIHNLKRGKAAPEQAGEILKDDHSWYKLAPTRIELIHSKLFGWDRQRVV